MIVFIIADCEKMNLYSSILASNSLATSMDISCEPNIPTIKPTAREKIPINNVSNKRITDIFLLPIPSSIYSPNSFFLLLIKKLFAYTIKNPNTSVTNTDTIPKTCIISSIICCLDVLKSSAACCSSILLKM